jgi:hypothetical protein
MRYAAAIFAIKLASSSPISNLFARGDASHSERILATHHLRPSN